METPIFISSTDGIQNSTAHDFTIKFKNEIQLDKNADYSIALESLSMSYSWHNIDSSFSNNTLKYSHDNGVTWSTITITNGNYSYQEICKFFHKKLIANGHSGTGIIISFVDSVLRVLITLEANFQVDFQTGDFSDLIGFNKAIVTRTSTGSKLPDITSSVDNLYIHTSIISDSIVSSNQSDVLFRFSVDNLSLSYPFKIEPRRLLFNQININILKTMRIYITDELNRIVDLQNIPVQMSLILKKYNLLIYEKD